MPYLRKNSVCPFVLHPVMEGALFSFVLSKYHSKNSLSRIFYDRVCPPPDVSESDGGQSFGYRSAAQFTTF